MKKIIIPMLSLAGLLVFSGCPINNNEYSVGEFPENATNFTDVNTSYDDYNSALPETHIRHNLIFSSNRKTQGGTFDIVGESMHITWYMETGELLIDNSHINLTTDDRFVAPLLQQLNTNANEFGPNTFGFNVQETEQNDYHHTSVITYSTDNNADDFSTYMVYYNFDYTNDSGTVFGPFKLHILEQNNNPQYISFFGESIKTINMWDIDTKEFTQIYFQSDNEGQTDIYKTEIPENDDFLTFLTSDTTYPAQKVTELSTASEDKCPFINGKTMVFTSDRPGGFGGYDLYYSFYENGHWSEPINFGKKINSEYDEFRPVTLFADGFKTDLLIFSSNRPGGLGGFDLYYAALPFKVYDWRWETD